MKLKVTGARRIGQTWHYNIRVPKRLSENYDLSQMLDGYKEGLVRGTMRTKCSDQAERNVRAVRVELDKLETELASLPYQIRSFGKLNKTKQERLSKELDLRIAKLPHDQKQLLKGEGGVWNAGKKWQQFRSEAAFLEAGAGSTYDIMDMEGKDYDADDRDDSEARDLLDIQLLRKKIDKYESALVAAGVIYPTADAVTDLRTIMEKYCAAKGYVDTAKIKDAARMKVSYAVRRFIEYHGNLPLADLTRKHLADFATDFLRLPTSPRDDIRSLPFRDAVKTAEQKGLPCVSTLTRNHNLDQLKRLMKFAVSCGDHDGPSPWADFAPMEARQKISTEQRRKVYVFTRQDVNRIVALTSKTRNRQTIDFWAPLFGAYHGLRIEELCQITVADIVRAEGLLCIQITDEGEGQTVKNKNTFRTIPVHAELVERGFVDFFEQRLSEGGLNLFLEARQHSQKFREIKADSHGRLASNYRQRFSKILRMLKIYGYRAGTHSFRHTWSDLARNSGIASEHRRALAGRDSDADGVSVDTNEDGYGHGFSIAVLAKSLNMLKPLD